MWILFVNEGRNAVICRVKALGGVILFRILAIFLAFNLFFMRIIVNLR